MTHLTILTVYSDWLLEMSFYLYQAHGCSSRHMNAQIFNRKMLFECVLLGEYNISNELISTHA